MKKVLSVLFIFFATPSMAQDMPPRCWEPYEFVQEYGQWSLNDGVWSMPFTCSTGVQASVNVNQENVMNLGLAEYYIQAPGIENDNTFFYTEPCGAMGRFCSYVALHEENIPTVYSLEN